LPLVVLGFLISETVDELGESRVGLDRPAGARGADRRSADQDARNLPNPLLHPRLASLPGFAAETIERGFVAIRAIAGENVDILDRDVELVPAGIGQSDAVVRSLADHDRRQPLVSADAMVGMDHQVARGQRRKFGKEGIGTLPALLATDQAVAKHVLFRQDRDFRGGESMLERKHDQRCVRLAP
jgi:hypothetical protein